MIDEIRLCSSSARKLASQLKVDIAKRSAKAGNITTIEKILFAPLKKGHLGQFSPEYDAIFLSDQLLHGVEYSQILSVALHESAHAAQYRQYGYTAHDDVFRKICLSFGVDEGYERARVDITKQSKLLERIRKLEALSSSPFEAEAQSALLKARQLMAENSIAEGENEESDSIYEIDFFEGKKIAQKQKCLSRMIKAITGVFVITVHYSKDAGDREDFSGIRGYGSYEELEVASYMWNVLERSIDKALKTERFYNPYLYKGVQGTTNFYMGAASEIIRRYSAKEEETTSKAIVLIEEKNRDKAQRIVFPDVRIVNRRSSFRYNESAYNAGAAFGSKVEINKPIKQKNGVKLLNS